jgi:hypothetical protein
MNGKLIEMGFSMSQIMSNGGMTLIIQLFDQADSNFDGYIDFAEFFKFSDNHQE